MSLAAGSKLGPYEIVAPLGAGGMGEVYRARDARLDRDVAIKILPALFADDPERLTRFEREAKALAALNHPNIAAIYGIEDRALIMELVEGEDLSVMIGRGALPITDVIAIAKQIADALEAAHDQGIVHRDLKPANIKVRADGTVKVLDFGLAKAMDPPSPEATAGKPGNAMNSPTMTARATQMGMIIGTAAYMSPEQAKGKAVDRRADIWAFGVVLYEMLTGRRAFEGDDISTTLAAVLMKDPEWTALPTSTPPALVTLVQRCLERDPKQRLRDIGEARLLLSNPTSMSGSPATATAPTAHASSSRLAWVVAGVAVVAAAILAALWLTASRGSESERVETLIALPPNSRMGLGLALSPDGRRLVLPVVNQETAVASLWIRDLSSGTPMELPQTAGAIWPFWSPDGSEIAFFADGKLKRVDLQGSPPQVICDAPFPRGGTWGPHGKIVLSGSFRTPLEIVDAAGGTPTPLTTLDEGRREKSHRWPVFLPGGDHVLFVAQTGEAGTKDDESTIEALSLETGQRTRLVAANSSPLYSADGYLLFWREGALRAQAFDARRLSVEGAIFPVASGVAFDTNEFASASVAADGTLVYLPGTGATRSSLVLVDRTGRPIRTIAESLLVEGGIAVSHDGTRVAAGITADGARDGDIWIYDLQRGTSGPLTFEPGNDNYPVWSADDTYVLYGNDRQNDGIVFQRASGGGGQAEPVASDAAGMWPDSWSRDRSWLVVGGGRDQTAFDINRFDRATKTVTPLVQTAFNEMTGTLSPDDRWLAYVNDQTGRREIYVAPTSGEAGRWQISTQGGLMPSWRRDGRELYFVDTQNRLMAVEIGAGPSFHNSAPRELFRAVFNRTSTEDFARAFGPMPDGQSFVIDVTKERGTTLLTFIKNWTTAAK